MSVENRKQHFTKLIKAEALQLGFHNCGISNADFLEDEAPLLEAWLNKNMHGQMAYMSNHFDKRLDPRLLVPNAKCVISLLYNYYTEQKQTDPEAPKISTYAYGEDYHYVVKDKLKSLLNFIHENIAEVDGRAFVDSAPVMDKVWAKKSGLGWMGKHTNLINKQQGSFFFIAELILDLELEPDSPVKDYCGTCTACIDACPTDAIIEPYVVDGSKCISYFTIELKEAIPKEFNGQFEDWVFGCDICQDVCPWNRFSKVHNEDRFKASEKLLSLNRNAWMEITKELFDELFSKSAVKRTGFEGLKRNLLLSSGK